MKFQLVTIIALVTIARDALATPMDHNDGILCNGLANEG